MCVCLLTENHRRGIASTIAVTNGILSLLGLSVIGIGVYIRTRIDELLSVLTDYDGIPFTSYVISVGCLVFFVHSMVAIFAYDWSKPLKTKRKGKKPPGRATTVSWVCMVGHCLFAIIALVAGVLCYGHRYVFDRVLDSGFLDAMSRYKNEQTTKEHIDRLQRDFMCCGSRSYKDWFETSWIHKDYIDVSEAENLRKIKNDMYYTDDTPFSCCSVTASRPCVHTRVMVQADSTNHGASLYRIGCAEALRIYFESNILAPTGHVLVFMTTLQIVSTILWRMLQSSYTSAMSMYDDPLMAGVAYCCRPRTTTDDVESSIQSPQSDTGQYIADSYSPEEISHPRYDNAPDEVRGLLEERRHSKSHMERSDEPQHSRTHDGDGQTRQRHEGVERQSSHHTPDRHERQGNGHDAKHSHERSPEKHTRQDHDRTQDEHTHSSRSESKQNREQTKDKHKHSSKADKSRTADRHEHSSKRDDSRTPDKNTSKPDSKQSRDRTPDKRTSSPERQSRTQTRDNTRTPDKHKTEKSSDRSKERGKEKRDASKSPRQDSRKSASPSRKTTSSSARSTSPSRTQKSSSPKSPKQKSRSKSPKPSKRKRK